MRGTRTEAGRFGEARVGGAGGVGAGKLRALLQAVQQGAKNGRLPHGQVRGEGEEAGVAEGLPGVSFHFDLITK